MKTESQRMLQAELQRILGSTVFVGTDQSIQRMNRMTNLNDRIEITSATRNLSGRCNHFPGDAAKPIPFPIRFRLAGIFLSCLIGATVMMSGGERLEFDPECLVIESVRQTGRRPVIFDSVLQAWVNDPAYLPVAGAELTAVGGGTATWSGATFDGSAVTGGGYRRGYLHLTLRSEGRRAVILEGEGFAEVMVNGEWHYGDIYRNNFCVIPLELRDGVNHFSFASGRGAITPRITVVDAPVLVRLVDRTIPDLVERDGSAQWGACVVINASADWRSGLEWETLVGLPVSGAAAADESEASPGRRLIPGDGVVTGITAIAPWTARKVGFRLEPGVAADRVMPGEGELRLLLRDTSSGEIHADETVGIRVQGREEVRRVTFISDIDGSVQYYGLRPATGEQANPGLVLSLHGASVEAVHQASCYQAKDWVHIVAPTNRRPFGFDWEDWGRWDALEVLAHAESTLAPDPARRYLTGHSMGGHGTWQLGVHFPDRFAAIGPSAGWVSFWSYSSGADYENPTRIESLLRRAASPSDTLALSANLADSGVYVLHGDADRNVPVEQARIMRDTLAGFHGNFSYFEQPGAGHWWGNRCMDWPRMFDFFRYHRLDPAESLDRIVFQTSSPGVSASSRWVSILKQLEPFATSSVDVRFDANARRYSIQTGNIGEFSISTAHLPAGDPVDAVVDGQTLSELPSPTGTHRVWFKRGMDREEWAIGGVPNPMEKGPHRMGPFKDAFRKRMMFVYGTAGTEEENRWSIAKARHDAEAFAYRGNGSVDVLADTDFDPAAFPARNVILYGNADTHRSWAELLGTAPIQVRRGSVQLGDSIREGDDRVCLFVWPRPGTADNSVGVVAGTGGAGMRAAVGLPYFVSGVHYPDYFVARAGLWTKGNQAVEAAGFFDNQWKLMPDDPRFHAGSF